MMKSLSKKLFICSIFICFLGLADIFGQTPKAVTFVNVTPNRFAPEFYGEDLSVKAALVDLPGTNVAGSTWTLSYEVYFLPEGHLKEVAREKGGRLGSETGASDFPKRIFLVKDGFTKKSLKTLTERTAIGENFKFQPKIPSPLRTEGADLFMVYTTKIYDAKLKKTLVKNSAFIGRIFNGNKQKREKMYLNFYVTPAGEMFSSQLEKENNSTEW